MVQVLASCCLMFLFLVKVCNEKENPLRELGKTGIMLRKEKLWKVEHRGLEVHG